MTPDTLTEHDVVEWLKERRANCLRIAAMKFDTEHERQGWFDDAAYFDAAIMMILGITPQDIHETIPERI